LIAFTFFCQYILIVSNLSPRVFNPIFQWPYVLIAIDFVSFLSSLFFAKYQKDAAVRLVRVLYEQDLITDAYLTPPVGDIEPRPVCWWDIFSKIIEQVRTSFHRRCGKVLAVQIVYVVVVSISTYWFVKVITWWWAWAIFCFFLYEVGPFILTYTSDTESKGIKRICRYVYTGRLVLMEAVLYGVLATALFATQVLPAHENLLVGLETIEGSIIRLEVYVVYPFVFYAVAAYGIHMLIGTAMIICFLSRRHIKGLDISNIDGHWGFKPLGGLAERNVIMLACSHGIVAGKFFQLPFEIVYQPGTQFLFFGFVLILLVVYGLPVTLAHTRIGELKDVWIADIQKDITGNASSETGYFAKKAGVVGLADNLNTILEKFGSVFEHLRSGSNWPSDSFGFGKVISAIFLASLPALVDRLILAGLA